jgi:hypothetical protein
MIFLHVEKLDGLQQEGRLRKVLSNAERKSGLRWHCLLKTPPKFILLEVVLNKEWQTED